MIGLIAAGFETSSVEFESIHHIDNLDIGLTIINDVNNLNSKRVVDAVHKRRKCSIDCSSSEPTNEDARTWKCPFNGTFSTLDFNVMRSIYLFIYCFIHLQWQLFEMTLIIRLHVVNKFMYCHTVRTYRYIGYNDSVASLLQ